MFTVILSLLLLQTTEQANREVWFGEVTTIFNLTNVYPSSNSQIYVIQQDRDNQQQYLLGLLGAIVSAQIYSNNGNVTRLVAGSMEVAGYADGEGPKSRFDGVFGLAQTDLGYIVTDYWNHCLRRITPLVDGAGNVFWRSSTYAGRCKMLGFSNGLRLDARFHFPNGLLEKEDILYITDSENQRMRKLDMNTEEVYDIHVSETNILGQFIFGAKTDEYYVNAKTGILKIQGVKEAWLVGSGVPDYQQSEKTQFSATGFDELAGITQLRPDFLLVTDVYAVKAVDLDLQVVNVICAGEQIQQNKNASSCLLHPLASLTVVNNVILLGEKSVIRQIPYGFSNMRYSTARSSVSSSTKSPSPGDLKDACEAPPYISKSRYEPLDAYPVGMTVTYRCLGSYTVSNITNNHLTCAAVNGDLVWAGNHIECRPSKALIGVIILSPVAGISLIILAFFRVKTRAKKRDCSTERFSAIDFPSLSSSRNAPLPDVPMPKVGKQYEAVGKNTPESHYLLPQGMTGDEDYVGPSVTYDYADVGEA